MGLVTVFVALVVSLVQTDGEVGALIAQLAWLLAGLAAMLHMRNLVTPLFKLIAIAWQ